MNQSVEAPELGVEAVCQGPVGLGFRGREVNNGDRGAGRVLDGLDLIVHGLQLADVSAMQDHLGAEVRGMKRKDTADSVARPGDQDDSVAQDVLRIGIGAVVEVQLAVLC